MSNKQARQAHSSSDPITETTDVAVIVEENEDARIERSAQRLAKLATDSAWGPATMELVSYIAGEAVDTADLNAVITEQLSLQLIGAKSAEDILTPFDPEKGAAYIGRTLSVHEVSFLESDYTEGFPYYAIIRGTVIDTGTPLTTTIGGERVVMQLAALARGGFLPMGVKIMKADKPTKAGFYPLHLVAAG